jgi:FkbM family methyltransferase
VGSLNFAPRLGVGYGWDLVEALALTESVVVGLVVGDGPGRARLEHRAAQLGVRERIHFLGRLDAAETVSAIAAMDVAISTQSNDSVGQVRTTGKLPLYLACACPVLASHVGEAASLLGPLGWTIRYEGTVDRDYPARLAARIALWRDQGAQQADRRRAALELADSAFDLDHARQRVYATLTAHNSQNGDDMDRPARRLSLAQRRGLIDRLRVKRLPTLLATAWKLSPSFKDALRMWALLARGFLEPHMPFLRTGSVRSVSVATNCGTRTVYLRENGSDLFTFYEIFIKRVYEGALPLRQGAVVVDLGANIGMTALWLATQADAVRVIAVEPEASNFEMLQRNVADDDVTVVHAAIADAPGQVLLELSSPSGHHITDGSDALLSRGNGQVVVAIHPDDLVSQFGLDEVDFLKVDIEGAEEAVFSKPSELAGRAELILMEIHNVDARETIGRAFKAQGLKTLDRRGAEALDGFARLHPSV